MPGEFCLHPPRGCPPASHATALPSRSAALHSLPHPLLQAEAAAKAAKEMAALGIAEKPVKKQPAAEGAAAAPASVAPAAGKKAGGK